MPAHGPCRHPVGLRWLYSQIQHWAQDNAFLINLYYTSNDWGMKETVKDLWVNPLLGTRLWEVWIEQ